MSIEGAPKPEIYNYEISAELADYRYATNLVVSNSPREIYISFVCAKPYERPRCVSRIIVSEEHLAEIVVVLSQQLQKFRQAKKQGPEGPETFKYR